MTDDERTRWIDEREVRVRTAPERMWRAWAEPAGISGWFADDARGEAVPGGEIVHIWKDFGMEVAHRVVAADPPRYLKVEGISPTGAPFLQEIHIHAEGGETVLRVVHSGFEEDAEWDWEYEGVDSGWWMAFGILKEYLEQHDGRPRACMACMRPTDHDVDALYRRFTRAGDLSRWLGEADSDLDKAGETVQIDVEGSRPLTGTVLAATGSEVALSWPAFSGVAEFKTFPTGDQRLAGIRCHTWSDDPEAIGEMGTWAASAVGRLLEF